MRIVHTTSRPHQISQQLVNRPLLRFLTPTPQAARSLGVPHQSLETLAVGVLGKHGWGPAPILTAWRAFETAVAEAISPEDVPGTARMWAPTLKEFLQGGGNFWQEDMTALDVPNMVRLQELQRLAKVYTAKLKQKRLVDGAELFWHAAGFSPVAQPLLVCGYDFPRSDELYFLNAVAGEGSILVLPLGEEPLFHHNHKALVWLQEQGWDEETGSTLAGGHFGRGAGAKALTPIPSPRGGEGGIAKVPPSPPPPLWVYPNLDGEVRGVLARVKGLLGDGVRAKDIAIVVRDEGLYGPVLLDVAWEFDVPLRALYAIPMQGTRLGSWVRSLLETVNAGLPFEATARLLNHPLCGVFSSTGLPPEIWAQARATHPDSIAAWGTLGVDLSILSWPATDRRDNWVQRLQNVLDTFQVRQRAARWAREAVAYYKLQESLVDLSQPEAQILTLERWGAEISQLLAMLTVPAAPGRGGVELHSPVSMMGTKYDHVFVLGMGEGMFPQPVSISFPGLITPPAEVSRSWFGLKPNYKPHLPIPGPVEMAEREARAFWSLVQAAAGNLTLSYPLVVRRQEILPSPFLGQLGCVGAAPEPMPLASLEETRRVYLTSMGGKKGVEDSVIHSAYQAWRVEVLRESGALPDEYDGVVGLPLSVEKQKFSPSQLTNLGQCPFKWFAGRVLRLAELTEAETELSMSLRGRLYHRCLDIACRLVVGLNGEIKEQLLTHLDRAFLKAEQAENLPTLPAWGARRQEHLAILRQTILADDFLPEGVSVLTTERRFEGEWYGLWVAGVIDRVDRTAEGLAIIDYKTSSQPPKGAKDGDDQPKLDIQLPLYKQLAETVLFPGEKVAHTYYYSLTKGKILKTVDGDEEALAQFANNVKVRLQTGQFPVQPDVEREACRYCAYDLVCRAGSRLDRK